MLQEQNRDENVRTFAVTGPKRDSPHGSRGAKRYRPRAHASMTKVGFGAMSKAITKEELVTRRTLRGRDARSKGGLEPRIDPFDTLERARGRWTSQHRVRGRGTSWLAE